MLQQIQRRLQRPNIKNHEECQSKFVKSKQNRFFHREGRKSVKSPVGRIDQYVYRKGLFILLSIFSKFTSNSANLWNNSETMKCTNPTESDNSEGVFQTIHKVSFEKA